MKQIAIYGRSFEEEHKEGIHTLLTLLRERKVAIKVYEPFLEYLHRVGIDLSNIQIDHFTKPSEITKSCSFLISIGGDGTLLDTLHLTEDSELPVLGINTGRLGFLSNIPTEEIKAAIEDVFSNKNYLDERTVIKASISKEGRKRTFHALNEVTVHKKDTSSMITVHTYINDELLNSYWCDGLIIATPTGSTAYNLSCGGPIIMPGSKNFVITPIAPHNLTVRPIVVPDDVQIRLKIEGRNEMYLTSLDSKSISTESVEEIFLEKASFRFNLIQLQDQTFFKTIRNKLMWGIDKRN